ncbi:MAG: hypothetical protein ACQERT_15885 [Thermodesulfobacteriota bacterium]
MHPFFHPGTQSFALERMAAVVDALSAHRFEQTWLEEVGRQEVDLELPMSMAFSFWLRAFRKTDRDMQHVLPLLWEGYFEEGAEGNPFMEYSETEDRTTVKCWEAAAAYARQRDRIWAAFGAELEGYIQNYCTHFVFAKSYVQADSLPEYVQEMIARVMVLKFLLVSHPGVREVADLAEGTGESGEKSDDLLQSLDSQVMRIMKTFSNNVPNRHEAMDALLGEMREQELSDLAHKAVMVHF